MKDFDSMDLHASHRRAGLRSSVLSVIGIAVAFVSVFGAGVEFGAKNPDRAPSGLWTKYGSHDISSNANVSKRDRHSRPDDDLEKMIGVMSTQVRTLAQSCMHIENSILEAQVALNILLEKEGKSKESVEFREQSERRQELQSRLDGVRKELEEARQLKAALAELNRIRLTGSSTESLDPGIRSKAKLYLIQQKLYAEDEF